MFENHKRENLNPKHAFSLQKNLIFFPSKGKKTVCSQQQQKITFLHIYPIPTLNFALDERFFLLLIHTAMCTDHIFSFRSFNIAFLLLFLLHDTKAIFLSISFRFPYIFSLTLSLLYSSLLTFQWHTKLQSRKICFSHQQSTLSSQCESRKKFKFDYKNIEDVEKHTFLSFN